MVYIILLVVIPLLTIGGVLLLTFLPDELKARRCPQCGRGWARENTGANFLGTFWKSEAQEEMTLERPPIRRFEKYKIIHRCKYCGHTWYSNRLKRQ